MISVIDAVMGTGKSTWAIKKIKENPEEGPYVVVAPLLSEVERYASEIKEVVSLAEGDDKLRRYKEALSDGKTVVVTHSLFQNFDEECFELAYGGDYSLYIDETVSLVSESPITPQDYKALKGTWLNEETVTISGNKVEGLIRSIPVENIDEYEGKHEWFIRLVRTGHIFILRDSTGKEKVVLLVVPPDKLLAFKEVAIMTYLFKGSETVPFFGLYGVDYEHLKLERIGYFQWDLVEHDGVYSGKGVKDLIELYDGKLNDIGYRKTRRSKFPLSWSWYESMKTVDLKVSKTRGIHRLSLNLRSFFRSAEKEDILWTCPKHLRKRLAERHFHTEKNSTWLAVNTRATNDYADRHYVAICQNLYPRMPVQQFFMDHGYAIDADAHALSMMVQFIWRSAIRKGEMISVYVPSERMRRLLNQWMEGEIRFTNDGHLEKAA